MAVIADAESAYQQDLDIQLRCGTTGRPEGVRTCAVRVRDTDWIFVELKAYMNADRQKEEVVQWLKADGAAQPDFFHHISGISWTMAGLIRAIAGSFDNKGSSELVRIN